MGKHTYYLDKEIESLKQQVTNAVDDACVARIERDELADQLNRLKSASKALREAVVEGDPYRDYDGLCALLRECSEAEKK